MILIKMTVRLVFGIMLLQTIAVSQAWAQNQEVCDTATARCTSQITMLAPNDVRIASFGLQAGQDGSEPVAFIITPLGTAIAPGIKIVAGDAEFILNFDVCMADGCRATRSLSKPEARQLIAVDMATAQMIPYRETKPVAISLDMKKIAEGLQTAGVTLED